MIQVLTDHYNMVVAILITALTTIFGVHWFLFVLLLFLNITDWITGWLKARITKTVNSEKGWKGVIKIVGNWGMVLFSFMISAGLIEIGKILEINLQFMTLIGWFVLASLIINEARSICENFIEAGFKVPKVLSNSLAIADKLINEEEKEDNQQ